MGIDRNSIRVYNCLNEEQQNLVNKIALYTIHGGNKDGITPFEILRKVAPTKTKALYDTFPKEMKSDAQIDREQMNALIREVKALTGCEEVRI